MPKTKSSAQRPGAFGKGGSTRMFKPQAAEPNKPGRTGKVQTPAPGAKRASGGKPAARAVGGLARPARAGEAGT